MARSKRQKKVTRPPAPTASGKSAGPRRQPPPAVRPALMEASQLHQSGNLPAAVKAYHAILATHPEQPHALYLLGALATQQGQFEQGRSLIERAIAADRRLPEAHYNLGVTLRALGRRSEAETAYRRAIKLRPDFTQAYMSLGQLLLETGAAADAEKAFREAVRQEPDLAHAHQQLAVALMRGRRLRAALACAREAIRLQPSEVSHRQTETAILSKIVPRWHFPMINEAKRNDAYRKAIEAAVEEGMHVLEIGTGSGLLAMMAARAGASRVTTCEMVPVLAEKARAIVAANGMSDRISVVGKRSNDLVVGVDLPKRADLLLSEVLSEDFISEGVVPSIRHARRELVQPNAPMIPRGGSVMAALVGPRDIEEQIAVETVAGFDLSAFNEFAPKKFELPHRSCELELLSEPATLLAIDLQLGQPPAGTTTEIAATGSGRCVGVTQWIRADLDGTVTYENDPCGGFSHWNMIFYRFGEPVDVTAGQIVRVRTQVIAGTHGLQIDLV